MRSFNLRLVFLVATCFALNALSPRPAQAQAAGTFTVNSTNDTHDNDLTDGVCGDAVGACTLRAAIEQVNVAPAGGPPYTIDFNIARFGTQTITPTLGPLPAITQRVTINGYTEPGAAANTNTTGGLNSTLTIVLNGNNNHALNPGLDVRAANCVIEGLVIQNFNGQAGDSGILLNSSATGTQISGCFIGTDAAGTTAAANNAGVRIIGGNNFLIGGLSAADRNLISGNGGQGGIATVNLTGTSGVPSVTIEGNLIGTDINGSTALSNGNAVLLDNSPFVVIGGTSAAARNVVVSMGGTSVLFITNGSSNTTVQGNYFNMDATGKTGLGGNAGSQIYTANNLIGGSVAGARNLFAGGGLAFQDTPGGNTVQGNWFGLDATGTATLSNNAFGLSFLRASGNTIIGNVFAVQNPSITLDSSDTNTVQGNYVGLNAAGNAIFPAGTFGGSVALNSSSGNLIGGTTAGEGNVFAASGVAGLALSNASNNNTIQGNKIGTDATGTVAVGNSGRGISIVQPAFGSIPTGNVIGGTAPGAGNIISGNSGNGIYFSGASNTTIQGNYIGVAADGTTALGNTGNGIEVDDASTTTVGGIAAGEDNIIANNDIYGIIIFSGTANSIRGNSIHDNARLGINLSGGTEDANGVTANDAGDADTGPNNLQNYPVLTRALVSSGTTTVIGTLDSTPNSTFFVDVYHNLVGATDPSGFGEGAAYFGSQTVTTDASGKATFGVTQGADFTGASFTATATANVGGVAKDTSEFSLNAITSTGPIVVNTNATGGGSLDAALTFANTNPGADTVIFNIPTTDSGYNSTNGTFRIKPTAQLPTLTGTNGANTTIDGSTQTAFAGDTNTSGPEIEIDGANAGAGTNGLVINTDHCTVQNVVLNGFGGSGFSLSGTGATLNSIIGCYVGTDVKGASGVPNSANGVLVQNSAINNTIGGLVAGARNIISGNAVDGIQITGAGTNSNTIIGNIIGLNAGGSGKIPNGNVGVDIVNGAQSNTVGGTVAAARNIISGNGNNGVGIGGNTGLASGANTINNVVQGNYIGTNATGTSALGNTNPGVAIGQSANHNFIGGSGSGEGNLISGNQTAGVNIFNPGSNSNSVQGNLIGTDAGGTGALPNAADGVLLSAGAQNNIIGGTVAGARNIISGNNSNGITLSTSSNNIVQNNYIGTNANGDTGLGNTLDGVLIQSGASGNTLVGNTISANGISVAFPFSGIAITDIGTNSNIVQGNFVGTNSADSKTLGNGGDGVSIFGGAQNNTIGGTSAATRNILSGNGESGIGISGSGATAASPTSGNTVQGNFIGTNGTGTAALPNSDEGVSLFNDTANNFNGVTNNLIGGTTPGAGNLISGNKRTGVGISQAGTTGNSVQGNLIGVDVTGKAKLPNTQDGVALFSGAQNNTVGGTSAAARNIISGNGSRGVAITTASNNTVQGNYIGTDSSGTAALPNSAFGVGIASSAPNNLIGGTTANARNIISGNANDGVNIQSSSSGNQVLGNYIGTDAGGTAALPNLRGVNIFTGAKNNIIGSPTAGNRIAFNTGSGVQVGQSTGPVNATGNTLVGNSIFGNGGLGINLQPSGEAANVVTPNDAGDADTGPNNLQNFPVLTNVTTNGGQTTIGGTLNSIANNSFAIDFYRNTTADTSGYGEGEVYIGRQNVTTDGSGNASFGLTINGTFAGQFFTATATNISTTGGSFGDTSEFALNQTSSPAALTLSIATAPATTPPTFSEGAGANAATGTVTRNSFAGSTLTVTLTSSNTAKVTVAGTVTIPAGQAFVTFPITAVDNAVADGSQNVIITASATGHNPDSTTVVVTDNDTAGIIVTPTTGLSTTSSGGTATFTVKLASQPTASVTIGLSSGNANEGTVAPTSLTFTPQNYNTPQTVTVTGVNDQASSSNQTYKIITAPAVSNDPNYNGLDASDVTVVNVYNSGSIVVTPTTGLTTTEAGGTATFSVSLSSKPGGNVTIPLSSSNSGEGTVAPASLLFTPQNFNVPQTVTVKGVDDLVTDGDQIYSISVGPATSSDAQYNGLSGAPVTVTNKDNDVAGFVVTPTTGLKTTKAGGQATFTIKLKSQPISNVRLGVRSSNPQQGVVNPVTLLFTPRNWNVAQKITITGVNNHKQEAPQLYRVTGFSLSLDAKYNRLAVPSVQVTNSGNNTVGFTVFPLSGLTTTSGGGSDNFAMRLNTRPTANVTIPVRSSDTGEGTVSPAALVFTPANWRTPQYVKVQGIKSLAAGSATYQILLGPAQSSDAAYNGLTPPSVTVVNLHQRKAGFFVTPQAGLTTTEQGGTATFTIRLNSQPAADVVVDLSSNNPSNGSVSPASLTFTHTDWNQPHVVTVTGAADSVHSLSEPYTIITAPAVSTDAQYNGLDAPDVQVTNVDNNGKPTITLNPSTATLLIGQEQQFIATVIGLGKVDVNWQVQEGDSGGTITAAGLYTAPEVPGRYHVVATVVGHPELTATAVVNVVTQTSIAFSWGDNTFGECGIGDTQDQPLPRLVNNITNVVTVAAGGSHSLALTGDGLVHAWGYNGAGQLGDGTNQDRLSPITVNNLTDVRAVAAGWYHSLALKQDGTVWAWGLNQAGQLGDGTNDDSSLPMQVQNLRNVQAIAAGVYFSLALKQDGTVWAWGSNFYGQLGEGTTDDSNVPVQVANLTNARAISAGTAHSVALMADGSVRTWGWNHYGQLGNGQPDDSLTPTPVRGPSNSTGAPGSANLTGVQAVAAGYAHTLFLLRDGTIFSCGNNAYGQLGDGTQNTRRVPVPVHDLIGVKAIAAGAGHSLALLMDGSVFGWGDNSHGQLGGSQKAQELEPVAVERLTAIKAIAAGYKHSLAVSRALGTSAAARAILRPSTGQADATKSIVVLDFVQDLDPATAADSGHYSVLSSGHAVRVESASYNVHQHRVIVSLPEGSLQRGDSVILSWNGLHTAKGVLLANGSTTLMAR